MAAQAKRRIFTFLIVNLKPDDMVTKALMLVEFTFLIVNLKLELMYDKPSFVAVFTFLIVNLKPTSIIRFKF